MPQLAAEELFTVSTDFLTGPHNKGGCKSCHQGTPGTALKDIAHAGRISDPSVYDATYCAPCHSDIVQYHAASVHSDQTGYRTMLMQRVGVSVLTSEMEEMLDDRCFECHTTCGQCHVSQPTSVNGGLIDEHMFKKTPNQTRNCTACHGARVGAEFKGENEGYQPSVHYEAGMNCFNCHTGEEIHGPESAADCRYDVLARPECADCHDAVVQGQGPQNPMHNKHVGELACSVCHSQEYKNCYQCHVAKPGSSAQHGIKFPSEMDLKIGRNPIKSEKIPWDYVLLRHIPISPDTFMEYEIQLGGFTSLPTWKYTSPHNIRRHTPQNASCGSCHGNANLFLTEFYIDMRITQAVAYPQELEANQDVIMDEIP